MTIGELEVPTADVSEKARVAFRLLSGLGGNPSLETLRLQVECLDEHVELNVPGAAIRAFLEVLAALSDGNAVNIVPVTAELTTQQAAELLGISRPSLVRLLESGSIAFRKVGTHRRVDTNDVLIYKRKDDARRRTIARELTQLADDMGLGY